MKKSIIAALSAFTLLLSAGCADSKTISFDSLGNVDLNVFVSDEELHVHLDETKICSKAKKKLVPAAKYNRLLRKVTRLTVISMSEPRRASRFVSQTDWAEPVDESLYESRGASYSDYISDSLHELLVSKVSNFTDAEGRTIRGEDIDYATYFLASDAIAPVVKYCKLKTKFSAGYGDLASKYNSLLSDVEDLADQAPWYPEGYNQWSSDSTIAWQWVNTGTCNLGDSCWHVKVISQLGCSSLYAELNMLDSNENVVDYTNDVAYSLSPYSTAVLEFSTYHYLSGSLTGRLTTINCY